ncbi:MAG: flippase-like domain-containing protein, partial [Candidatus Omnitrophica bacterium]|nr:flippase-like domain-containing protein [Candidatus Omnitrophota bacterium]
MRKIIQLFLRLFISIGILFFLFSKIDKQNFLNIIKALDVKVLIFAFFVFLLSNLLGLYRWKNILDAIGINFYFKDILSSFSAGLFFNLLLPSAIGGDILRSLDFIARTHKPKEVLCSIFLDRLSGYIGLDIVLIFSLIIGYRFIKDKDILWIASVFSIFLLLILFFLFNNFLYSKLNYLLGLFKNRFFYILKEIQQYIYYFKD